MPNYRLRVIESRLNASFKSIMATDPGSLLDKARLLVRSWPGHIIHGKDYVQAGGYSKEGRGAQGIIFSSSDREQPQTQVNVLYCAIYHCPLIVRVMSTFQPLFPSRDEECEQDSQDILPPETQPPLHNGNHQPGVDDEDKADSGYQDRDQADDAHDGQQQDSQFLSSPPLPVPSPTPPLNESYGNSDLSRSRSMSNSQGNLSRVSSEEERGELMKGMKTLGMCTTCFMSRAK